MMKTSPVGIKVMHTFEACKLLAYPDPASDLFKACQRARIDPYSLRTVPAQFAHLSGAPWTIGWGDTGNAKPGQTITQAEADDRFNRRLAREFEPMANTALAVPVSQGAFDGFVSALYNIGPGGPRRDGLIRLRSGSPSTFLRILNTGNELKASDALMAWNKAGGAPMLGVHRRRFAERLVMRGHTAEDAIRQAFAIMSI